MMKPYPNRAIDRSQRIFNYRLSRARRVVENAFGIIAARFAIYHRTIPQGPENATKFVLASIALHNYLRSQKDNRYCCHIDPDHEDVDHNVVAGQWRQVEGAVLPGLDSNNSQRYDMNGVNIREGLRNYFTGVGAVPWQNSRVFEF